MSDPTRDGLIGDVLRYDVLSACHNAPIFNPAEEDYAICSKCREICDVVEPKTV